MIFSTDKNDDIFEWSAAISQMGEQSRNNRYSLKRLSIINGMTFRPGDREYISRARSLMPSFSTISFDVAWPIVIEGKSKGNSWPAINLLVMKDLNKAVALISLAWDSTWYLLEAPYPEPPTQFKIPRNDTSSIPYGYVLPQTSQAIPRWMSKAWSKVDSIEILRNALHAHHQGLLLAEAHPSFALIAFIAVVEIIGKSIIGEKCACCNEKTSSNKRFRAGIDTVVTDEQKAKELYALYKRRSVTAHEGKLHGNEELLGVGYFPDFFNQDYKTIFMEGDLQNIRSISRDVLIKALRGK